MISILISLMDSHNRGYLQLNICSGTKTLADESSVVLKTKIKMSKHWFCNSSTLWTAASTWEVRTAIWEDHAFERFEQPSYCTSRGGTCQPFCPARTNQRTENSFPGVALMGSHRTAALRSGIANEWRIFASARVYDSCRLRGRLSQNAVGQWSTLADADHSGCHRRFCQDA